MRHRKHIIVIIIITLFTGLLWPSLACTVQAEGIETEEKKLELPIPVSKDRVDYVRVNWGWNLFDRSATEYCHDLSVLGVILSCQAENSQNDLEKILTKGLGFSEPLSINYGAEWNYDEPAMTFAYKDVTINNQDKKIVVVVIKGTTSIGEIKSDIGSQFDGFFEDGRYAYKWLTDFMRIIGADDINNTILYITGHSYGGAVAQLLAMNAHGIKAHSDSIFCYTFEAPLVETFNYNTEEYKNVHNIINTEDIIPYMPVGKKHLGHEWYYDSKELPDELLAKMFDGFYYSGNEEKDSLSNMYARETRGLGFDHNCGTILACLINGLPKNMGEGAVNRYSINDVGLYHGEPGGGGGGSGW